MLRLTAVPLILGALGAACSASDVDAPPATPPVTEGTPDGGSPPPPVQGEPASLKITVSTTAPLFVPPDRDVTLPFTLTANAGANGTIVVKATEKDGRVTAAEVTLDLAAKEGKLVLRAAAAAAQGPAKLAIEARFAGLSLVAKTEVDVVVRGASGTLDTTFGKAGVVTDFGGAMWIGVPYDAVGYPDGTMLLSGQRGNNASVVKLKQDGTTDPAFGGGSPVNAAAGQGAMLLGLVSADPTKAFYLLKGGGSPTLHKVSGEGAPSGTFGTSGVVSFPFSVPVIGTAITALPSGKVLTLHRYGSGTPSKFAVVRTNDDGTPDTGYGTNGACLLDASGVNTTTAASASMLVEADGSARVWISGDSTSAGMKRCTPGGTLDQTVGTAPAYAKANVPGMPVRAPDGTVYFLADRTWRRESATGVYDTTVGEAGKVTVSALDSVQQLLVQRDGKLLFLGDKAGTWTLIRFPPNLPYQPDATFGAGGSVALIPSAQDFVYGIRQVSSDQLVVLSADGATISVRRLWL